MARDIWTTWSHGTGAEAVERNGRLEMTIAPDAVPGGEWNLISVAFGTVCRLLGDFDVRVEYELLEWPRQNGASVQIAAFFQNAALSLTRESTRWGDSYSAWYPPAGGSHPTDDKRGVLRIRRTGGRAYAHYLQGGRWSIVKSFLNERAPNVGISLLATDAEFAHQRVRIAFDNFQLTAAQPVC
jgi:hypothetical protein